MEPDLCLLRYFTAVAEHLHSGRQHDTCTSLSLRSASRSASRSIFDVELFRRASRHVEPAAVGGAVLVRARKTPAAADRAIAVTHNAARGKASRSTVGC
jgi:DNA-binding transcriptional LysR family regulator